MDTEANELVTDPAEFVITTCGQNHRFSEIYALTKRFTVS